MSDINALLADPAVKPTDWNSVIGAQNALIANQNALRDQRAQQAVGDAYRQALKPDGTIDQPTFNRLVTQNPQAAWQAQKAIQGAGDATGSQASSSTTQQALHLARLNYMNGLMQPLLQNAEKTGQPITRDQIVKGIQQAANDLGLEPDVVKGVLTNLNSLPPGANLTDWVRGRMAANTSAQEQLQKATPTVTIQDTGDGYHVIDTNPQTARPGSPGATGSFIPSQLSPSGRTDMIDVMMSDGSPRQVARGELDQFLKNNPGATTAFLGGRQPRITAPATGATSDDPGVRGPATQDQLTTVTTPGGVPFRVNKNAAEAFSGFFKELEDAGYHIDPSQSGGFNPRKIAGQNDWSHHADGTAVDINSANNPRGASGKVDLPPNVGDIAAKYGLTWGGNWKGDTRDPMHFEYHGAGPQTAAAPAGPKPFTGPNPIEQDTVKTNVESYNRDLAGVGPHYQNVNTLQNARAALEQATRTGKGTGYVQPLLSLITTISPEIATRIGAANQAEQYDLAKKYLTDYARSSGAASHSDAQLSAAQQANPSLDITNLAARDVVSYQIGRERQAIAQTLEAPDKSGKGYAQHAATFAGNTDPRGFAWDTYTPEQQKAIAEGVAKDKKAEERLARSIVMSRRLNLSSAGQ